jgi:hypothetical protein
VSIAYVELDYWDDDYSEIDEIILQQIESGNLVDTQTVTIKSFANLVDSNTIIDTVSIERIVSLSISEIIQITVPLNNPIYVTARASLVTLQTIGEVGNLVDLNGVILSHYPSSSESGNLIDSESLIINSFLTTLESGSLQDTLTPLVKYNTSLIETLDIIDLISTSVITFITVSESGIILDVSSIYTNRELFGGKSIYVISLNKNLYVSSLNKNLYVTSSNDSICVTTTNKNLYVTSSDEVSHVTSSNESICVIDNRSIILT